MSVQAVVYQEHTLGYISCEYQNGMVCVDPWRAYVSKGATFKTHPGPFVAKKEDLRPATKADFVEYRVNWHPDYLVAGK